MSDYENILDKISYSFSTLHGYEECPYYFYLKKIEKNQDTKKNSYAEVGSYGHELLERIFTKKISPEEALEECSEEFEFRITEYMSEESLMKKYEALCQYLVNLDVDAFFDAYEVLGVEKQFKWKIDNIKLIGFADLILKRKSDGVIILVDHKSSGHFMKADGITPLKNQEENLMAYTHQMYLYADAMKKTMGFYPDKIVWNHFLDGGKKSIINFDDHELASTLDWVRALIKIIYEDDVFDCKQNYMMCHVLCDYRDSCEYNLEEDDE